MTHVFWVVLEEGMDRPLTWHVPPPRRGEKPRLVYRVEVPLPDVDMVDGVIHISPSAVVKQDQDREYKCKDCGLAR